MLKCPRPISRFNIGKCSAFTYIEPSGSGRGCFAFENFRLPIQARATDYLVFRVLVVFPEKCRDNILD
jgi:hypothetical protein